MYTYLRALKTTRLSCLKGTDSSCSSSSSSPEERSDKTPATDDYGSTLSPVTDKNASTIWPTKGPRHKLPKNPLSSEESVLTSESTVTNTDKFGNPILSTLFPNQEPTDKNSNLISTKRPRNRNPYSLTRYSSNESDELTPG